MAKTSDWKIVATEGATVDKRTITATWIKDMAETYSHDLTTALIWPEHYKGDTPWGPYEGKNWGIVEELKAEKRAGKYRLLAKITPNSYLLAANKDGQKLFTSIEPDPDYCGTGRCYLRGLGVTDKPASTGCTRLKFSDQSGGEVEREVSELEELDFSECQPKDNPLSNFFSALANLALHGELPTGSQPIESTPNEDDEPMNPEQFNQMMTKLNGIETKQVALEEQQKQFSEKLNHGEEQTPTVEPEMSSVKAETQNISAEQFNQLMAKVDGLVDKQDQLGNQFNELKQEAPGQSLGQGDTGEETKSMKVV
ncbi:TPA: GPO family capsid scaffolding protein [Vibrio parahaemolyticus]|nr:GPO family capsid scaffolding protein [Vibrio parahaemolyticus]MBE3925885.1 capsid protein [Vibrio parahaemolyticus]MBE5148437.1 capsid protein [Vibrio parahaemolyticus]MDF4455855.1 GPO family capsid scaffolding protein [Vibrio parahaemolyticus]MDF4848908.1 GPO family capsid scaffolding protein [Vibrio parahaemolyticus]